MNAAAESRPGLVAFSRLRAEDEPWLARCFVPPADFERMAGPGSAVIFGEAGAGKTSVQRMLRSRCVDDQGRPLRLIVDWRLTPNADDSAPGSEWVQRQLNQILDMCAWTLAGHVARAAPDLDAIPAWAWGRVIWFIQRCLQGDRAIRLGPLIDESPPAGAARLREIVSATRDDILYPTAGPDQVIAELMRALRRMGLDGIWIMTDGLEAWAEAAPDRVASALSAFLSTLALFEQSGLAYKLCLPAYLRPALLRAVSVQRRRVEGYELRWSSEELRALAERRLTLIDSHNLTSLSDLCSAPGLTAWLERVGGGLPREWLDQLQPLVEHYLSSDPPRALDEATWKRVRANHPPRFRLDEAERQVRVGGRLVSLDAIPAKAYDILRYLYQHSDQVVGKADLYYRAYRGLPAVPHSPQDKGYEPPKHYDGLIDTNIYRLRQALEPDPDNPVLLVTVRGHGIRLVSRW